MLIKLEETTKSAISVCEIETKNRWCHTTQGSQGEDR